jgi:uncharacterized protein YcfL
MVIGNSTARLCTFCAFACVVALAGCGTVNTVSTRTEPSANAKPYVQQVNAALDSLSLKARDVRLSRTRGGNFEAQVDVANDDFRTRNLSYRFDWLDGAGNVLQAVSSDWRQATIASGGSVTISSVAPTADAADFRLQLRAAN